MSQEFFESVNPEVGNAKRNPKSEIASDEELRLLLERLHRAESLEEETARYHQIGKITVEDVAEAVGMHPDLVAQELDAMHQEWMESRVSGVLRELEEPLYRVERPGNEVKSGLDSPLLRMKSVQTLASKLREDRQIDRKKVDHSPSKQDRLIANVILAGFGILFGVLAIKAVYVFLMNR